MSLFTEGCIGEIRFFAGNFAPRNWAFCDGQLLSINSNQALFSIIGITYGGDGQSTFALPDLRGRFPLHPGSGPGLSSYSLGQRGGVEQVTLTVNQMPAHSHTYGRTPTTADPGDAKDPTGAALADSGRFDNDYKAGVPDLAPTTSVTGGNQSHENRPPFCAINAIICLQGIFPSAN